ncbi:MAG: hypothetical protein GY737_21825 [Desulfobacteraceae bacterium]|nr:hypothetical protein [Desulfobacteraceae bacterium]
MEFTRLFIGETVTGRLSDNEMRGYQVSIEANQKLVIKLEGPASQDFDLYVKYGEAAARNHYDFKSITMSADESITIGPTKQGDYYILIYAYRGMGDFVLSTEILSEVLELNYGQQVHGRLGGSKDVKYYRLKGEEGKKILLDLLGPMDADFDLYLRYGEKPTNTRYDKRSYSGSSKENITVTHPKTGDYYVMVHSYRGGGEFTLSAASGVKTSALIITSKEKLKNKYGQDAFNRIQLKIEDYRRALDADGLSGNLVYVDDVESMSPYGLSPVDPGNAFDIKGVIDQLDKQIHPAYFLILGGHSIIPFHILPNPCGDDGDTEVHSDNPYASRDEDLLIPERALGRLPDDNSRDPAFLISLLETATSRIRRAKKQSFGYSAKVWKEASRAVYGTVRYGRGLQLSPPIVAGELPDDWLNLRGYFYFNLHGSEETRNWYGQEGWNYPVAFTPDNLADAHVENAVACCEACYGANIIDKRVDEAISLTFMAKKAACFVGSTKIAYGPSVPPCTDADLIVMKFFERIKEGNTFGDAFLKAKQDFARESVSMKGYLDGTDKKTLLEFVMFADPLSRLEEIE